MPQPEDLKNPSAIPQPQEPANSVALSKPIASALHRIGNEINSLSLVLEAIEEQVRDSEIQGLFKANRLIADNKERLYDFLTMDPKGKHLAEYLLQLGEILKAERHDLIEDLEKLRGQVKRLVRVFEEERARNRKNAESLGENASPTQERP